MLLPYKGFLQVVGGFYGGAHFIITIGVLLWMLFKRPQFYRFWRTALFLLTMTAVGIFALYPAMPPRLLKDSSGHTITVDTLDKVGGLWSYNHGVIERISDGYAPMPSLHLGWSTWVALRCGSPCRPDLAEARIAALSPGGVFHGDRHRHTLRHRWCRRHRPDADRRLRHDHLRLWIRNDVARAGGLSFDRLT